MKLKEFRLKNKLTQKEVGKIINKTATGYGYYESGKNEPDIKTLCTLADFYHTSVDDLIGRKQPELLNTNLLSKEENSIINIVLQLNPINQVKVETYAFARLEEQNSKK